MDPITAVLVAGAEAGVTSVATLAIADLYGKLKAAVRARHPEAEADIEALEAEPRSATRQAALSELLVGAGADTELVRLAEALLEEIEHEAPKAASTAGVDLARVKAEFLEIRRIDGGVRARDVETVGGITITDVQAGGLDPKH
ncbi:hypothetical protein GCM10009555_061110 [Acrocarpospora macrocephala]|uniref:RHIM domain-containing protein n=1 Tax=Acrocarpospora macrocephala TaxID=150177 RepID=A0A5M3WK15_9ACTN|nr:hypothetical protein [Acrocarpospora macrocephala]GES09555.1 hypothetical protein Amac_031510 [Acrocarpospora macrocephala]